MPRQVLSSGLILQLFRPSEPNLVSYISGYQIQPLRYWGNNLWFTFVYLYTRM